MYSGRALYQVLWVATNGLFKSGMAKPLRMRSHKSLVGPSGAEVSAKISNSSFKLSLGNKGSMTISDTSIVLTGATLTSFAIAMLRLAIRLKKTKSVRVFKNLGACIVPEVGTSAQHAANVQIEQRQV